MTPQIQEWVKKSKDKYIKSPGKVLEIGSLNINGGIREYFNDAKQYIGIDLVKGHGVDKVLNAHDILKTWGAGTFDTVICLEALEHDNAPWITRDQIYKILRDGGYLIISTPTFGFPLHRFPKDYFRFGEDAFRDILFSGFKILKLEEVRDIENNPGIVCIGKKLTIGEPWPSKIRRMLKK